jgi:hypothetical protein
MKAMWVALTLLSLAAPLNAQPADTELNDIEVKMKGTLGALSVIDASDKKIKQSEEAQQFTTDQINKMENEIKRDTPELLMDARRADEMRQHILDLGCPEQGGAVTQAMYNTCEPLVQEHTAFSAKILARANAMKEKRGFINEMRRKVSDTLLSNNAQRKHNREERERLTQLQLQLQAQAVAVAVRRKPAAARACRGITDLEAEVCCQSVVYDGKDPKLCNAKLICQTFKAGGLFGSAAIVCN